MYKIMAFLRLMQENRSTTTTLCWNISGGRRSRPGPSRGATGGGEVNERKEEAGEKTQEDRPRETENGGCNNKRQKVTGMPAKDLNQRE